MTVMTHPDEAAGYRAAVAERWARGAHGRGGMSVPGMAEKHPPPEGCSEEFARGWREGIRSSRW